MHLNKDLSTCLVSDFLRNDPQSRHENHLVNSCTNPEPKFHLIQIHAHKGARMGITSKPFV